MAARPEDTQRIPLTFERGLNEFLEESMLPDGAVGTLTNWEPSPTGELRPRARWLKGSTTSAPAGGSRKGRGIGFFSRLGVPAFVQASSVLSSVDTSTVSGDVTFTAPTAKNNLIIIVATLSTSDGATTLTAPSGFTQAVVNTDTNLVPRTVIYYRENAPSTTTITVSGAVNGGTASGSGYAQAFEFSGFAASSSLDVTSSDADSTSDTDLSSGTTASTAQAVELTLATVAQVNATATFSGISSTYTRLNNTQINSTGNDLTSEVWYKITSASGTQGISGTSSASARSSGAVVTFKAWHNESISPSSKTRFLVANNASTAYDFYALNRESLGSATWVNEGSISVSDATQHVSMAPGLGRTWITNPQFLTAYVYDGETVSAVTGSPTGGRTVAVHKNRVFMGGSDAYPGRLWYSNIADGTTWGTLDYINVSADDGEPIEDITPQGEVLIVGKRTGLWMLSGSGNDNFDLVRLGTGGVAPGRSLSPTPYGTVAVGRTFVWLISADGQVDKIGLPISSSWLYTTDFVTTSFVDDVFYMLSATTGEMWALNMQTGTWRMEVVDGAGTEEPAIIGNHDFTQVYAPMVGTNASLLNYRDFPTVAAERAKDFSGISETFSAKTREVYPTGPEEEFTPRWLFLRLRQHNGVVTDAKLQVTARYRHANGTTTSATAHDITPVSTAGGVFRERVDLGGVSGVIGVRFQLEHAPTSAQTTVFDIEEATLEVDIERKR